MYQAAKRAGAAAIGTEAHRLPADPLSRVP
jgi:hypothetical protein